MAHTQTVRFQTDAETLLNAIIEVVNLAGFTIRPTEAANRVAFVTGTPQGNSAELVAFVTGGNKEAYTPSILTVKAESLGRKDPAYEEQMNGWLFDQLSEQFPQVPGPPVRALGKEEEPYGVKEFVSAPKNWSVIADGCFTVGCLPFGCMSGCLSVIVVAIGLGAFAAKVLAELL